MQKKTPLFLKISLLLICLTIFLPLHLFAEANSNFLISIDELEKFIGNPESVILDCRDNNAYNLGHIPGAVTFESSSRYALRDGTGRVKPLSEIEKIIGNAGIDNDKRVVVYSDAKDLDLASTAFWILEYLGDDKVYFLNGGITAWQEAGKSVSKERMKTIHPVKFKGKVIKSRIATTEEIVKIAKNQSADIQLIDSRSKKEYTGEDIRSLRGGRIPNTTINIPHEITYDKKTGKLLSEDMLASFIYKSLDKNKRTIAYCQTGARATVTYLDMRLLGFKNPAVYDDSWVVYGNSIYPPYPIENEQWINLDVISKMKKTIDKLAKEVIDLKTELSNMKVPKQLSSVKNEASIKEEAAQLKEESWMNPLEESGCGMAEE